MYTIDDGVRFKKCIPGETNIIDEPTIPKLYPNGNYSELPSLTLSALKWGLLARYCQDQRPLLFLLHLGQNSRNATPS